MIESPELYWAIRMLLPLFLGAVVSYVVGKTCLLYTSLFIGAMIGLVTTDNLLVMYFFWETVGLCSYALIGFELHNPEAVKAGLKAFITTKVGDVGLLTGIMVLYVSTGTFNIFKIIDAASAGQIPGFMLALAGFGFLMGAVGKSAQVPLHILSLIHI